MYAPYLISDHARALPDIIPTTPSVVDPDRGRPVEHDDHLDMAAAPAVEPYTYSDSHAGSQYPQQMSEASHLDGSDANYNPGGYNPGGYSPVPLGATLASGAAGTGAGAGAGYSSSQYSNSPYTLTTAGPGGVSRGPSSAGSSSQYSSSQYAPSTAGFAGAGAGSAVGAGMLSAGAAKRAEAERERNRMHLATGAVPEEGGGRPVDDDGEMMGEDGRRYSRGAENVIVHADGGRVDPAGGAGQDNVELPPTYGSIPADRA